LGPFLQPKWHWPCNKRGEPSPRKKVKPWHENRSRPAYSAGGAPAAQIAESESSIDAVAQSARERGVTGAIAIQLSPWQGAPLFVTNRTSSLSEDRIITAVEWRRQRHFSKQRPADHPEASRSGHSCSPG
jgi:hypothetical protein